MDGYYGVGRSKEDRQTQAAAAVERKCSSCNSSAASAVFSSGGNRTRRGRRRTTTTKTTRATILEESANEEEEEEEREQEEEDDECGRKRRLDLEEAEEVDDDNDCPPSAGRAALHPPPMPRRKSPVTGDPPPTTTTNNTERSKSLTHICNLFINEMSSTLKGLVSKKRRRYKQDGFDLDLSYICENVIAMGFPGEKIEGLYRNNIDDVNKFLETKHPGRYKIYNLCSERSYNPEKFKSGQVAYYPFNDHNPPSLDKIPEFCCDIDTWLRRHPENVAAVHCKAGKGRTGLMICCYLLHTRKVPTAQEALTYYATKRTHDRKGVTIPSQQRYVNYYQSMLHNNLTLSQRPLKLTEVIVEGTISVNYGTQLQLNVYSGGSGYNTGTLEYNNRHNKKMNKFVIQILGRCQEGDCDCAGVSVQGDVRFELYSKNIIKKEKLCHFWFNTFFVQEKRIDDIVQSYDAHIPLRMTMESESDKNRSAALSPSPVATAAGKSLQKNLMDRTMSCPPPADTQRPPIPQQWRCPQNRPPLVPKDSPQKVLSLKKGELDKAHKDKVHKIFSPNFQLHLFFQEDKKMKFRSNSLDPPGGNSNSRISTDSSDEDDDDDEALSSSSEEFS